MNKARKINELSRDELKSIFISSISGQDKEVEIRHTLAIFTAYNLPIEAAMRYDLLEYCTDELINVLFTDIDGYDYDSEEKAWNAVLETLSPDKILDIIENIDSYTKTYNEITIPVGQIKYQALKLFARLS